MSLPIVLSAPAKINLSLDVLDQREDGYHWVEMVLQSIDLSDTVSIHASDDNEIKIACNHSLVPLGEENLAWRAAQLIKEELGIKQGVVLEIDKNIPIAAGLAGGSADAAAVLLGLNQLWKLNLSDQELAELGLRLGADVPFCLHNGTALARGIGERLTPLTAPPRMWVVLLKPNIGVSTAEVYNSYTEELVQRRPDTDALVAALRAGGQQQLVEAMANVLESVTFARWPMLRILKQKAVDLGALTAQMSGTGPTIFALASGYQRALTIYNGLKHQVEFSHLTTFREGR